MATAQDEFNALFNKTGYRPGQAHPEDAAALSREASTSRSPTPPAQSFLADSDSDDDEAMAVRNPRSTYYVPRGTRQANTGPKGVIADAQAFEEARRLAARSTTSLAKRASGVGRAITTVDRTVSEEEEEDDVEADDAFMSSWRQRRLQELSNKPAVFLGQHGRRVYGSLTRVTAEGFLDAVDHAPGDTVVVCLIYDLSEESAGVEECVRKLARKFDTTRWIKMGYEEAEFERAGCPALIAYRGGEKFAGFVPVQLEVADVSVASLAGLLQRHQVL